MKNMNTDTILKLGIVVLAAASAVLNTVQSNRSMESAIKREIENYMKNNK